MIKHQMNSQLGVLKELQNLIDKADAAEATGDVSAEDIDHLRGYVEDMRRACKVAIALEEMLSPKQEKAAAKSEEKSAPKKKSRPKKKAEETPAPAPAPAPADEDDALDFLD